MSRSHLPIHSSHILFYEQFRATYTNLAILFSSVPTKILDTFKERLTASLTRIVENGIDMQRMAMIINRAERQVCKLTIQVADIPDEVWAVAQKIGISKRRLLLVQHHIRLPVRCRRWIGTAFFNGRNHVSQYPAFLDQLSMDSSFVKVRDFELLRSILCRNGCRFYVEQHSAVVIGKPSASLADKLEKAEKARIADRISRLGPEGLKEAERKLEAAKKDHRKPIPPDILTSFPIPDVKSISWIPVQTVHEPGEGRMANPHIVTTSGELREHIESDGNPLPFFVAYDHVEARSCSLYSSSFLILPTVRLCWYPCIFLTGQAARSPSSLYARLYLCLFLSPSCPAQWSEIDTWRRRESTGKWYSFVWSRIRCFKTLQGNLSCNHRGRTFGIWNRHCLVEGLDIRFWIR